MYITHTLTQTVWRVTKFSLTYPQIPQFGDIELAINSKNSIHKVGKRLTLDNLMMKLT